MYIVTQEKDNIEGVNLLFITRFFFNINNDHLTLHLVDGEVKSFDGEMAKFVFNELSKKQI